MRKKTKIIAFQKLPWDKKPRAKKKPSFSKEYTVDFSANKEPEQIVQAVKTILKWSGKITNAHIKNRGGVAWTTHEQLCHNISEIGEVYEAIRKSNCVNEIMQEMIDILFSATTNINIFKITRKSMTEQEFNKILTDSIRAVFNRVTARVNDAGYQVGSKP